MPGDCKNKIKYGMGIALINGYLFRVTLTDPDEYPELGKSWPFSGFWLKIVCRVYLE
jgi:hypothetical protein